MTWNHRVIRRKSGLGVEHEYTYAIHEVYYGDTGEIQSWTSEPVSPAGEGVNDLGKEISRFSDALRMPVLEELDSSEEPKLAEVESEHI